MSFGQRPQRMRISAAVLAVLGKLRPRAANPTHEWQPGKRWGGQSGGGSQRMRVAKFLSRPLENPKTYTGPKRNRNSRRKRRDRRPITADQHSHGRFEPKVAPEATSQA